MTADTPTFPLPVALKLIAIAAGRLPSRYLCAWCPDFNPYAPSNRGASHGICPACTAKLEGPQ